jgi:hypothetical protein
MTPLPPPWPECLGTLQLISDKIEAAHAASLSFSSDGGGDAFTASCSDLARTLADAQPALAKALASGPVPGAVREKLQQVQTALTNLQNGAARLQAHADRAVAVMFPEDQVRAYSKLGHSGYGSAGKRAGTYLRA